MEGVGLEDAEGNIDRNKVLGLSFAPVHEDKQAMWMGGVMNCFSSVFSLFSKADAKSCKEPQWEVKFETIKDLVYLGSGAQGVVFGGNLNGEMVAVKKLRDKSETNIRHLRNLNHENIVRFRGVCTTVPYCVVMEYCQYGPLFEFLHSGACFAPKQVLKWAKEIAQGMSYLHAHKIIHRDLKSPNVLIADNLVVKVSDFGTSREWNDVSAIMSFTGTVAWMAPEMIRHEPCSERVDVWSYGVVLWELLTAEVPYKNLETNAIMWGVGTDTISLPIPASFPDGIQLLITQCWNRVPRNRPPFKIIRAHLEIAGEELNTIRPECFSATQATWREKVDDGMKNIFVRSQQQSLQGQESGQRREEARTARDMRQVYEQQLKRANELYLEVCAVKLQLEQREKALIQREMALQACRCAIRKGLRLHQRQSSTSSDVVLRSPSKNSTGRRAHLQARFGASTQSQASTRPTQTPIRSYVETDRSEDAGIDNKGSDVKGKKDTVVENNGNVDSVSKSCTGRRARRFGASTQSRVSVRPTQSQIASYVEIDRSANVEIDDEGSDSDGKKRVTVVENNGNIEVYNLGWDGIPDVAQV